MLHLWPPLSNVGPPASRLPIRWRLTLWYAALLAAVMVLFAGAIYLSLRQQLYASLDEQLLNQAALTLTAVTVTDDTPRMELAELDITDGEYVLRLLAADGRRIVALGHDSDALPGDAALMASVLAGQTVYRDALDEEGETIRVVSVPVIAPGEGDLSVGVLQIGLDRNEIDEPLARLLASLALAGPLVLLLAAGAGYLLAGRALAAVVTITDLASRLDAQDLGVRLALDLPDDELGRLARAFDAMLARIDDAFARQRRFTGDAAHELRTPLSLLRSQVDLALARPRSIPEYQEALRGMDTDLERLTSLVGTLLTLARADAGRLSPDRALFDLAQTIDLLAEQYAPLTASAGVRLEQETVPTPLQADEDLLLHLLVNLLDNALAHTPAGARIALGCRPEGGWVRLWVVDSGSGIAPEHVPRVFDRFYRVDAGRGRDRGGAGLGLAICQAIVEAHGGVITLASEVEQGTRIEVVLPVVAS